MPDPIDDSPEAPRVEWLSGAILTFLNKLVLPALWLAGLVGIPLWVLATTGRISITSDSRFFVVVVLIATVLLSWLTVHLQSVGYCGRSLVVANYWREARIPFEDVESVEPVWWFKGRLVRIRFHRPTPFGSIVYYMPKWGPLRAMFTAPEKDLQEVIWPSMR